MPMENPFQILVSSLNEILTYSGYQGTGPPELLVIFLKMEGHEDPTPVVNTYWSKPPSHLEVKNIPLLKKRLFSGRHLRKTFFSDIFEAHGILEKSLPHRQMLSSSTRDIETLLGINPFNENPELIFFSSTVKSITLIPIMLFESPFAYIALPGKCEDKITDFWSARVQDMVAFILENWMMNKISHRFTSSFLLENEDQLSLVNNYAGHLIEVLMPMRYSIFQPDLPKDSISYFPRELEEVCMTFILGDHFKLDIHLPVFAEPTSPLTTLRKKLLIERVQRNFSKILLNWRLLREYQRKPRPDFEEALAVLRSQLSYFTELSTMASAHREAIEKLEKVIQSRSGQAAAPPNLFYFNGNAWELYFQGEKVDYEGLPNASFTLLQFLLQNPGKGFSAQELRAILVESGFAKTRKKKEKEVSVFSLQELAETVEKNLSADLSKMKSEDQLKTAALLYNDLGLLIKQTKSSDNALFRSRLPYYYTKQNEYRDKIKEITFDLELKHDDAEFVNRMVKETRLLLTPQGTITDNKNLKGGIQKNLRNAIGAIKTASFLEYLDQTIKTSTLRPFKYEPLKSNPIDWSFLPD